MITYTGGTFDVLHIGHLELLAACRQMAGPGGRVVVALNTDEFVARYKNRATIQRYEEREEVLRSLRDVDLVVKNAGDEDSRIAIEVVQPDVIVIGDDWRDKDYLGQLGLTQEWLAERGLWIEYVPRTKGRSTSSFRQMFEPQEITPAMREYYATADAGRRE